jgi:hypothetical protein
VLCSLPPLSFLPVLLLPRLPTEMMTMKKQIGINHTPEGISRGRQPAGQVEGEQYEVWSIPFCFFFLFTFFLFFFFVFFNVHLTDKGNNV